MDFKNTLLIAFLFIGINSFAQNRLEFNQIVSLTGSNNSTGYFPLDTVPEGKAYKITSYNQSATSYNFMLTINGGLQVGEGFYGHLHPVTYKGGLVFPLWLKAGDILGVHRSAWGEIASYHISGIEFNIVE
jgi:hypothetical protein